MLYAIIENGGKQYRAEEGGHIEIDLLPEEIGKKKSFKNILLLVDDENVQIGAPYLKGVSVDTTIIDHFKAPKITVFKYRAKQRYRVKTGHRQKFTRVLVESIAFPGKSTTKKTGKTEKAESSTKKPDSIPETTQAISKPAKTKNEPKPSKKEPQKEIPSTRKSINSLEMGGRTTKALLGAGINTVGQLLKKLEAGENHILDIAGIGEKSVEEIKNNLKKFGFLK